MRLLSLAIVLATLSGAVGHADWPNHGSMSIGSAVRIHPAVVRVITPLRDGMALGSGTLVAVNDTQGLVVSNWHVVDGAAGPISVLFPDGFSSTAVVLKTDRDWDLAALLIRRPTVEPVPLATRAPRRGELLTIAGYGSGTYRTAAGRCTQYVAPGPNRPMEMVELATSARQGDSGGPIFNAQGQLAGVLFGTGGGSTTGSYCGRVRGFLASIVGEPPPRSAPEVQAIAQRPRRYEATAPSASRASRPLVVTPPPAILALPPPPSPNVRPLAALPAPPPEKPTQPSNPYAEGVSISASEVSSPDEPIEQVQVVPPSAQAPPAQPIAASSMAEQLKTALALIGLLAILFHGLRLLSLAQGS